MTVRLHSGATGRACARLVADLLILAGISGVLLWIWALADGFLYQYVQGVQFPNSVTSDVGSATGEDVTVDVPRHSKLIPSLADAWEPDPKILGRLEVPAIGLSVLVRDGVDTTTLRKAVGHLPSSALPGDEGNFVVLGHRDTFFRPLRNIARGDTIRMRTRQRSFTYIVDSISVVSPDFMPRTDRSARTSTLITCFPFHYIGTAPLRMVVEAELADADGEGVDQSTHIE